ncbi:hypothetical protein G6F46_004458 [Rhizopus delemar]|uniref:Uncharacterized protein n=2 Tax=Rhizopus TaxID=4842 RepID=A0A9P6YRU7_9FUNG|nr:hypothetical protein G6F55_012276 [Rhizopus delemar]KAG1547221.1 hypothetical protein G6F51_004395 [Rhizopus arrhizus]KAG1491687.1 hypothetical protein G6F54_009836 [Rhizopus delemar]KAG1512108.1 hypothetical protein G6F53_005430 [Rhizopus delemar]KAG1555488.1 hypothetical protein G6F49_007120 [Rhizopus delemar]
MYLPSLYDMPDTTILQIITHVGDIILRLFQIFATNIYRWSFGFFEVYARAKSLDSHGETNMKSLPSFTSLFPNLLSVGIHEEADGGAAKMKLKIGIKTMNVLIIISLLIKKNKVFVGPETPISIGFHAIFYETNKAKNFVTAVKDFFDG